MGPIGLMMGRGCGSDGRCGRVRDRDDPSPHEALGLRSDGCGGALIDRQECLSYFYAESWSICFPDSWARVLTR